ncbi:MAG: toll/interleukin-1 receptor domain-containing protein [Anaerolineae bacterium]
MKRIFLSYRRSDSADFTTRLYERLAKSVGRKNLFKDIDSIPGGRDFRAAIEVSVLQSDIMLVIIGPSWLTIGNQIGRRLDNPEDPVRNEIELAMRHGKQILPILIDSTPMPREDELPPRLHSLSYLQAHRIRTDGSFETDVRGAHASTHGPHHQPHDPRRRSRVDRDDGDFARHRLQCAAVSGRAAGDSNKHSSECRDRLAYPNFLPECPAYALGQWNARARRPR